MDVLVQKVSKKNKSILSNLMEFYQYDFSEFELTDVNQHGLFGYSYTDYYFIEKNRHPYFVLVEGQYAGFVLINNHSLLADTDLVIAEFFIMRKYRQQGVGKAAIKQILCKHSGLIEVPVSSKNKNGLRFWKKVFVQLDIQVTTESSPNWDGLIFKIQNTFNS